jgi:hypothetical protein
VNIARSVTPETVANTVSEFGPTPVPRVQVVEALPSALVVACAEATLPLATPTAKLTAAPSTGPPEEDVTRTTTGCASSDPASPLCPFPETT